MSLSNIDKSHLDNLLLSVFDNNNKNNHLQMIQSNYSQYGKLKQIAEQINRLKKDAYEIIEDAKIQNELHLIKKNFKLVSGTFYYLYEKETKINVEKYFSLISPNEWKNGDKFLGKYFYDFDKQFVLHNLL